VTTGAFLVGAGVLTSPSTRHFDAALPVAADSPETCRGRNRSRAA
jgi:hypothetical protein